MEIQQSPCNNTKHSPSKSPNTYITRMLRPLNGPSRSPLFFKQTSSRARNTSIGNRTNENLGIDYADDAASFNNPNLNHDFAGFSSLFNNSSLNPSPYKQEFRGFNSSLDRNPRRPFESPFAKFCDNLSPLQSRGQTPLSHVKNIHTSSEQILKFPFGSPMTRVDESNSPFPFKSLPRQRLDFSGVDHKNKEGNKVNKLRDDCSFNGGSDGEANEEQPHNHDLPQDEPTSNQPFKFNLKFQKSKYSASNPFPVLGANAQQSKTQLQHGKTYEDKSNVEAKKSAEKNNCKIEESPNSPARKSMRRLYNSSNMHSTETNHTLDSAHYSDKIKCEHSHDTSSNTGSAVKQMSDEDPEDRNPGTASATKKKVICNCKKSKCLKLYCDCFAAGEVCGPECNCCNCHNNEDHSDERNNAILSVLDRNPLAFRPKIDKEGNIIKEGKLPPDSKSRHNKGCNCKKSGCLKKYCECYAAGVKCSELCKCETCKNMDHNTIIKKAQSYNHMAYLNSGDKVRQFSEGSDCDSCCSHQHHENYDEERCDSDPEYQSAYAGRYSSKKTKTSEGGINVINEVVNKRSLRLRDVTPTKRNQRGLSQNSSPAAERDTKTRKLASMYRTPYPGGDSSKKLNFSQHTSSPSRHLKTTHDRNAKKLTSKLPTSNEYQSNLKVKSEF